jgi:hypothetical protein
MTDWPKAWRTPINMRMASRDWNEIPSSPHRSLGSRRLKRCGFGIRQLWFCSKALTLHAQGVFHSRPFHTAQFKSRRQLRPLLDTSAFPQQPTEVYCDLFALQRLCAPCRGGHVCCIRRSREPRRSGFSSASRSFFPAISSSAAASTTTSPATSPSAKLFRPIASPMAARRPPPTEHTRLSLITSSLMPASQALFRHRKRRACR